MTKKLTNLSPDVFPARMIRARQGELGEFRRHHFFLTNKLVVV